MVQLKPRFQSFEEYLSYRSFTTASSLSERPDSHCSLCARFLGMVHDYLPVPLPGKALRPLIKTLTCLMQLNQCLEALIGDQWAFERF
jgi:hypothetical protein